jgi:UDPglucose--hexose-1-phosphate uridylyltransferase
LIEGNSSSELLAEASPLRWDGALGLWVWSVVFGRDGMPPNRRGVLCAMPELRKDPVTGRWVIISTERAKRPAQFIRGRQEKRGGFCPFCPGNEKSTPPEVLSYRPSTTAKDTEGWWLRVVPNKFPALKPEGVLKRSGDGIYDRITGFGIHEVLIESPNHEHTFADLPESQIEEIIWALRDRVVSMRKSPGVKYVLVFKNWGAEAGASIEHPHCQIIGLPIVPKRVQEELVGAEKYYDYKDRCVYCDMVAQELESGERVVMENDTFLSFCPYASVSPFEICIIPKEHVSYFSDITKNQVADLSRVLRGTLALLKEALDDPPYNFVIHTAPFDATSGMDMNHYHWHIEIVPKLTKVAGFEWGSGFYINPTPPEEAAAHLRSVALRGSEPALRSDTLEIPPEGLGLDSTTTSPLMVKR